MRPKYLVLILIYCFVVPTLTQADEEQAVPTHAVLSPVLNQSTEVQVNDLMYHASVEIRMTEAGLNEQKILRPTAILKIGVDYAVKTPNKYRYTFTSFRSSNPSMTSVFTDVVGTTVVVNSDALKILSPTKKLFTTKLANTKQDSLFDTYPNVGMPIITSNAYSSLQMKDEDWKNAEALKNQTIGTTTCSVYQKRYEPPLLDEAGGQIAATRRYVDVSKGVTMREEQIDTNGEVTATTDYSDFKADNKNNLVALFSRTTTSPSRPLISLPFFSEKDKKNIYKSTTIPVAGRVIERQFEFVNGEFPLLSNFRLSDQSGNLLMTANFTDFVVNQGIADSLFDFPKLEITVPTLGQAMPMFTFPDVTGTVQGPVNWIGKKPSELLLLPTISNADALIKAFEGEAGPDKEVVVVAPAKPKNSSILPILLDSEGQLLNQIRNSAILVKLDKAGFVRTWQSVTDTGSLKAALATYAPEAIPEIKEGQIAPEFAIRDMNGKLRRLSDLRGKKNLLLTFFPKCFTGGCKNHLTSINDLLDDYKAANTEVWAVSVDAPAVQRDFAATWNFQFPLLSDEGRNLSLLYGAAQDPSQLSNRMSIFIDEDGIIRFIDKDVNVTTHGTDVLKKMAQLGYN